MVARVVLLVILWMIAAAFVFVAMGFLITAAYFGFATILPPPEAALAVAGVAMLVALSVGVVAYVVSRSPQQRAKAPMTPNFAAVLGSDLGSELKAWSKGHGKDLSVAALAFGFALGVSPRLRRAVLRLLR